tara:strand:+ start:2785 stop:3822 length:1038 start_codon:yes stop_codon:yes gene_type:complete
MSCDITSGIAGGCNTNIGGVKNVYLRNTGGTWYKYEMDKGTASLVETYNVNQASSILGFTQTLTIQLDKMEAAKQVQIQKIAQANDLQVQVETNDSTIFEFGIDRGAYMASGTSTSGTAYTDANQSELVIQADSKQSMTGPTTPPINSGDIFVQYNVIPKTGLAYGGFPTFEQGVVDSLETTPIRPIGLPFVYPLVGFNYFGNSIAGAPYFVNQLESAVPPNTPPAYYTNLQAQVEFNFVLECTQDFPAAYDYTTTSFQWFDGNFGNTFVSIPNVTGLPPSVAQGPLLGDTFTVATTAPFVIPINPNTNNYSAAGGVAFGINNQWTAGLDSFFKTTSGQITFKMI